MIVGIILATLLGLGGLYYIVQLSGATPAIIETLITPFTLTVTRLFQILGALAPLLVALVPLYLVLNMKKPGKDQGKLIAFSAVYGLAIYGLAVFTGLDTQLIQAMRGSMFVGSTLGLAVSTLGGLATWIMGIFSGLLLWGTGLVLVIIEGALDTLVGVGEAARQGKRGVRGAQRSILNRIGGRQ
jgi:hypothetical protein